MAIKDVRPAAMSPLLFETNSFFILKQKPDQITRHKKNAWKIIFISVK